MVAINILSSYIYVCYCNDFTEARNFDDNCDFWDMVAINILSSDICHCKDFTEGRNFTTNF